MPQVLSGQWKQVPGEKWWGRWVKISAPLPPFLGSSLPSSRSGDHHRPKEREGSVGAAAEAEDVAGLGPGMSHDLLWKIFWEINQVKSH